jgi:membrane associated rhomboid family serine protease
MSITLSIIIITAVISIMAFQNPEIISKGIFNPVAVSRRNEWYRFFSSGFLHANWLHLILNMYVLWLFGNLTEQYFQALFQPVGKLLYLALYLLAIPVSETYSYIKHRNNYLYNSLGASGAVSAVLFASILFMPLSKTYLLFIPVGIPAFVFGPLYLAYCAYMSKHGNDQIGHDAHFYGAVFGFIFPVLFKWELITEFFYQILAFRI